MKKFKKGFTLIELLVVISIIGILASLTLVSYTGAQKQTRDTQRRSDLNQIRNSLENYAGSNNGLYPKGLDSVANLCSELVPNFMATCPADPSADQNYGFYSSAVGDEFILYAILETGGYWEVCSTGGSGKAEDQPTDSTCDLN
jgi:general secretion pathway protein G